YMPDVKSFGWWTAADTAVWSIYIPETNYYQLQLEWSVADDEAGKLMVFDFGGSIIKTKIKSSGAWETFKKEQIGKIRLSAGKHNLRVFAVNPKEKGYYLDLRSI